MGFLRGVRRTPDHSATTATDSTSRDVFAYEMILIRHMEQDSMLWQTPALAITGQAFLLTLAFDPAVPFGGRLATALLGIFIAIMSMQLMAKHRYLSQIDAHQLEHLEVALGLPGIARRGWANDEGGKHILTTPAKGYWNSKKSYYLWVWGLWAFVGVNALALLEIFVPGATESGWVWISMRSR